MLLKCLIFKILLYRFDIYFVLCYFVFFPTVFFKIICVVILTDESCQTLTVFKLNYFLKTIDHRIIELNFICYIFTCSKYSCKSYSINFNLTFDKTLFYFLFCIFLNFVHILHKFNIFFKLRFHFL